MQLADGVNFAHPRAQIMIGWIHEKLLFDKPFLVVVS
jgi:hypothetical protein